MISYRKLAMRVLGHSPVSAAKTARRRSTAKRAAALALTAALVVGMTLPAFAQDWFIEMVTSRFRLVQAAITSHRMVQQLRMTRTRLSKAKTLLPRLRIR